MIISNREFNYKKLTILCERSFCTLLIESPAGKGLAWPGLYAKVRPTFFDIFGHSLCSGAEILGGVDLLIGKLVLRAVFGA